MLTQKIATDNLADAFMAFNTNYHDTGLFGVYAVTDRERSPDLSWVIMNEVRLWFAAACIVAYPKGRGWAPLPSTIVAAGRVAASFSDTLFFTR